MTYEEKVAMDAPLNRGELCRAVGETRDGLRRLGVPFPGGKCRKSEYFAHRQKCINDGYKRLLGCVARFPEPVRESMSPGIEELERKLARI